MIKYICDCCNIEANRLNYFEFYTHLNESFPAYVDKDGNGVSGRMDEYGLCNSCYNIVVSSAVNKFKEIRHD